MIMGPMQAEGGRNSANINLRKIENGFQVTFSKEEKKLTADGNNFLYDYINETYAFDTLDEAVEKVRELGSR